MVVLGGALSYERGTPVRTLQELADACPPRTSGTKASKAFREVMGSVLEAMVQEVWGTKGDRGATAPISGKGKVVKKGGVLRRKERSLRKAVC